MVFSSGVFLILFLPLALAVYYIVKKRTSRNLWLLLVSLFFYAWGEPRFVFIMLLSIVINWGGAILMERQTTKPIKKGIFILLLIIDIGLIFIFKYLNFAIENLNGIFKTNIGAYDIALPIGISFFTFQIISYVIDVYRKKVPATKNLPYVALYVSMFPQLIAGPIVRYSAIRNEIYERVETRADFIQGIRRFVIGLGKKAILADLLAGVADEIFLTTNAINGLTVLAAWIGAVAYAFQIYFDFSGYSDMAIGLGKCFGFHFEENFNYPYIAASITDFWKRWHISLTNWFRDYVYIPLGGNRCTNRRHIFNLFITWLLTGLWHGANWTFILWGMIYFLIQLFEKKVLHGKSLPVFGRIYTMLCTVICWAIFRSDSISDAFVYMGKMFGVHSLLWDSISLQTVRGSWVLFAIAVLCCIPWKKGKLWRCIPRRARLSIEQMFIVAVFLISLLSIVNGNYSPFVYFNF